MHESLCSNFLAKIEDQIERINHLVSLIPEDRIDWTPPMPKGFSMSLLLGHLLECFAGFCAVLHAANPVRLAHFLELKQLTVNQRSSIAGIQSSIKVYLDHIREGFVILSDPDLTRRIPTVFVPDGESLLSLLLINFEHLASHKYQLFMYLRILGTDISSRDLYHFSGQSTLLATSPLVRALQG